MSNLYKIAKRRLTDRKNVGYDYKGKILRNSMDDTIFKNPKQSAILEKIENIINEWILQVKRYKARKNYFIDKDEEYFN